MRCGGRADGRRVWNKTSSPCAIILESQSALHCCPDSCYTVLMLLHSSSDVTQIDRIYADVQALLRKFKSFTQIDCHYSMDLCSHYTMGAHSHAAAAQPLRSGCSAIVQWVLSNGVWDWQERDLLSCRTLNRMSFCTCPPARLGVGPLGRFRGCLG